ncbi:MAG: hypothetical protein RL638_409 [Bacteroidota bacterium]|jgi:hypothetical protein
MKHKIASWFIAATIITLSLVYIKKIIVLGMIVVGAVFFPEASTVLRHYCFGNGDTLHLQSDYIRTSPVVQKRLQKMRVGQETKLGMHQWEDWRLSYAINGFQMKKKKDKVVIRQWIKFDGTGDVITWFGPIPLPDNIVHTFDCKPFWVYHEFPI